MNAKPNPLKILNFVFVMLLFACGTKQEPIVLEPKQTSTDSGQQQNVILDYAFVSKTIFNSRCTICHEQYKSYTGITRELTAIRNAIDLNRMPKSGSPLNAFQKDVIQRWIQLGAPEFSDQPALPIQIPPLVPDWKSIYNAIIAPKCLVCHNPNGQAKFLDFSNRDSIFKQSGKTFGGISFINFENIDESYLLQVLSDEDEPMPPVWSNISVLNENEKIILKKWLSLGLPETTK